MSDPPYRSSQSTSEPGSVYVGNLLLSTTDQDLEDLFSQFGAIRALRRVTQDNGQCRGFAFLDFADSASVDEAIKALDQTDFKGRIITVQKPRSKWGDPPPGDRRLPPRGRRNDRGNDYDDGYDRRRFDDRYRERSPPRRYPEYDEPPPRREYRRERSPERDRRGRYEDDYYR
jgi:RNA recognition motif-containing protein